MPESSKQPNSKYTADRNIPGAFEGETVTRRRLMTLTANAAGGLAELARAGDLEAVTRLAKVIALCAKAHAEGRPEEAEVAWRLQTAISD